MLLNSLYRDETGFIISAEFVLIATICVIGLVVGLSEIQHAVVAELNDVAEAIGSVNQSFFYSGMSSWRTLNCFGPKALVSGSVFIDMVDECDWNQCALTCDGAIGEAGKGAGFGGAIGGAVNGFAAGGVCGF